jgi:hypothetical protein
MTDKTYTIAEVKNLPENCPVKRIEGVLKVAFKQKSGTSGNGSEWRNQGFVLANGEEEMICTLWDRTDLNLETLKGQHIVISTPGQLPPRAKAPVSTRAGKDKDGHSRMELTLTKLAIVVPASGGVPPEYRAQPAPTQQAQPTRQASSPSAATASAGNPIEQLEQLANYWERCYARAGKNTTLTPEARQAMASSLFIAGERSGLYRQFALHASPPAPALHQGNDDPSAGAFGPSDSSDDTPF